MKTFYTSEREIWREWLAENFETESEIWLVFPMKESGDKSLLYNDAVEEALCFGWIDSTIKHIDPTHRAQRFTPRKKGSPYSRPNIERYVGKAKASCSIGMRFSQSLVVVLKEKPGVEQGFILYLISFRCQEVNHPISRGE